LSASLPFAPALLFFFEKKSGTKRKKRMGSGESAPEGRQKAGYQVLQVQPGGPAALAGLTPCFDFVVASGATRFDREGPELVELLRRSTDKEVNLSVYSSRTDSLREVVVVPASSTVGLSVRFAPFESAPELVWHVLDVAPDSPAARAGLVAGEFVVGSPEVVMTDSEDLFTLVNSSVGTPIPLYVYDAVQNTLRITTITPGVWGSGSNDGGGGSGHGNLGCDVGFGILHRLPTTAAHAVPFLPAPSPPSPSAK
jgi:S1-C subfamily serine protease